MKKSPGFTIVEMSVVLVVMGILVSVAIAAPYLISSARALGVWSVVQTRDLSSDTYELEFNVSALDSEATNRTYGLPGNGNGKYEWPSSSYIQNTGHTGNEVMEFDVVLSLLRQDKNPKVSCKSTADLATSSCATLYTSRSASYAIIDKTRANLVNTGDGDVFVTSVYSSEFNDNIYLIGMKDPVLTSSTPNVGYSSLYAGLNTGVLSISTIKNVISRVDAKFDDAVPNTGSVRVYVPQGSAIFAFPDTTSGGAIANTPAGVLLSSYVTNPLAGVVAIEIGSSFSS